MVGGFRYSEAGLALTKEFEGLRLAAYVDSGGVWTVGYGHTGPGVGPGLVISEEEAEIFLEGDLARAVAAVNRLMRVGVSQGQFDALVDFAFNLGCAALAQSTLLREVNAGDFAKAAKAFLEWDHVGGVVNEGLLRRRRAEAAMFAAG